MGQETRPDPVPPSPCKVKAGGGCSQQKGAGLCAQVEMRSGGGAGGGAVLRSESGSAGPGVGGSQEEGDRASRLRPKDKAGSEGQRRTNVCGVGDLGACLGSEGLREGGAPFHGQQPSTGAAVPSGRLQFPPRKNFPVCRAPWLGGHRSWCEQDSAGAGPKPKDSWTTSGKSFNRGPTPTGSTLGEELLGDSEGTPQCT